MNEMFERLMPLVDNSWMPKDKAPTGMRVGNYLVDPWEYAEGIWTRRASLLPRQERGPQMFTSPRKRQDGCTLASAYPLGNRRDMAWNVETLDGRSYGGREPIEGPAGRVGAIRFAKKAADYVLIALIRQSGLIELPDAMLGSMCLCPDYPTMQMMRCPKHRTDVGPQRVKSACWACLESSDTGDYRPIIGHSYCEPNRLVVEAMRDGRLLSNDMDDGGWTAMIRRKV